jgi:hypothetical protein
MTYRITDIVDEGGSWGRHPKGEFTSIEEALEAAHDYINDHIDEGDYGQSPLDEVQVKIWIDIADADGDEERHGYTASVGGTVEVSRAARALYKLICESRHVVHIDADDQCAADELVDAGIARWAKEYMSDSEPGLRPA